MSNPNPFLFGGPPAVSDNPFMDAGSGMGDINPFMAQAAPMMTSYNPYNGQQYGGNMAMHTHPEVANPFGDYSSMGYAQQSNMMSYQQAANPYFGQQMAHINTSTNLVPSNAMSFPAVSAANAGAALFDVAPQISALDDVGGNVYSPPEANPFLASVQATPQSGMSSVSCTPAVSNPFADEAVEELVIQQPVADLSVDVGRTSDSVTENNKNLVSEDEIEEAITTGTSLLMVKLDVTEGHSNLGEINPSEPSDSETVSLAGEEVKQIFQGKLDATIDIISIAPPEISDPPVIDSENDQTEIVSEQVPGFSGIFSSNSLGPTADTMQVATSHVDLYSETHHNDGEEGEPIGEEKKLATEKDNAESSNSDEEEAEEKPSPTGNGLLTGGTAAGLFDDAGDFNQPAFKPPTMSTGDALFADMPSMPDIKSTGAAIFGLSDESAAGTTGAQLFDIVAPEAGKPSHGAMTGWDENFDRKFEKAEMMVGTGGLGSDAFCGGSIGPSAAAFGYAADPSFAPEPLFGDSFGMLPVSADMNNPFLAESGMPGPSGGKSGDGETPETPLFDADDSKPLEPFPRVSFESDMWEMFIRHPPKKKITSQRFWKKVFVKIAQQGDTPAILLYDAKDAKDPFQVCF